MTQRLFLVLFLLIITRVASKKLTTFPPVESIIHEKYRNGISQDQFLHHDSTRRRRKGLRSDMNDDEELQLHLFCTSSARDENTPLHQKHKHLETSLNVNLDIMKIDKRQDIACYSGSLTKSQISSQAHILERYNFLAQSVPTAMKVHNSVMAFIEKQNVSKPIDKDVEIEIIFYRPTELPKSQSEEDALKASHVEILSSLWQSINVDMERSDFDFAGGKWEELREKYSSPSCQHMPVLNTASLELIRDVVRIPLYDSFEKLQRDCFMRLVEVLADKPEIGKIEMTAKARALNFEARGLTQTGTMLVEPFSAAGLDGTGQVVGIADSGLSDLSCYFYDGNPSKNLVIERNLIDSWYGIGAQMAVDGVVDVSRRKVINYNYNIYTDEVDDPRGHGTHVAGTVLGNCPGSPSTRGMASGAKTSFFDIGLTGDGSLAVYPSIETIFDSAKFSGARIHTNSWGVASYHYSYYDSVVDEYLFSDPDMLILFAAGNDGVGGHSTVGSPAVSKNCISVGAMTVKQGSGDNFPISESTVASFSSLGPVDDNRYGIDVVAPGDPIFSACSGSSTKQSAAVDNNEGEMQKRAACEMSGTSMATPAVAGVAAQMRQFLMDKAHWETVCNPHDFYCRKFDRPKGALLKSMIIHSAEPVTRYRRPADDTGMSTQLPSQYLGSPPDVFQGFGAVTMSNVIPLDNGEGLSPDKSLFLWESLVIEDDEAYAFHVNIPKDNAKENLDLKVTIAWYDPALPATSTASKALVNDVDLIIKSPAGVLYHGNHQANGDTLNPVEQVHITDITDGDYVVYVIGHIFAFGTQDVSITMTYPSHRYPVSKQHRYVTGPIKLSHSELSYEIDNLHSTPSNPTPAPVVTSAPLPARAPSSRPPTWEDYEFLFSSDLQIGPNSNSTYVGSFQRVGHLQEVELKLQYVHVVYSAFTSVKVVSPDGQILKAGGSKLDSILPEAYQTEPWAAGCCYINPWVDGCCPTGGGKVPVGGADMYSTSTSSNWDVYLLFTPGWDALGVYGLGLSDQSVIGSITFTFDNQHGAPTWSPTSIPLSGLHQHHTNFTYCSLPKHQRVNFHRAIIDYNLDGRNGSLSLYGLEPMFYPRVRLLKLTMVFENPDGSGKINHHATKIFIAASEPHSLNEFHANFEIIEDAWHNHPTSIRLKFMGDRMIGPPQPDGDGNLVWPDGTFADEGTKRVPSHNHLLGCFYFDPKDVSVSTSHTTA